MTMSQKVLGHSPLSFRRNTYQFCSKLYKKVSIPMDTDRAPLAAD